MSGESSRVRTFDPLSVPFDLISSPSGVIMLTCTDILDGVSSRSHGERRTRSNTRISRNDPTSTNGGKRKRNLEGQGPTRIRDCPRPNYMGETHNHRAPGNAEIPGSDIENAARATGDTTGIPCVYDVLLLSSDRTQLLSV